MSVYIRGMEMPKSCFYCPFRLKVDPDTFVCLATNEHIEETFAGTIETRNRGDCPLVPVPPHGRLIDADALEEEIWSVRRQYQLCDDTQSADKMMHGVYRAERLLKDAPTIIEAEDKE